MPCELLGWFTASAKSERGAVISIKDTPANWGGEELKQPHCFIAKADESAADLKFLLGRVGDGEVLTGHQFIMTPSEVAQASGHPSYSPTEIRDVMVAQ